MIATVHQLPARRAPGLAEHLLAAGYGVATVACWGATILMLYAALALALRKEPERGRDLA